MLHNIITSVGCTGIKDETGLENKLVQHWYYKQSPRLIKNIIETLRGERVENLITATRTAIPSIAIQFRLMT